MTNNPELQRLLANLRGTTFTPNLARSSENPGFNNHDQRYSSLHHNSNTAILNDPIQHTIVPLSSQSSQQTTRQEGPVYQQENRKLQSVTPTIPNASTIIAWPTAVRFVSKYIVPSDTAETRIKHMISEQRKHENEWWVKREDIVRRQDGRVGNQQKAAALLKSLGGISVPVTPSNPGDDKAELDAYDRKVYHQSVSMSQHFDKELRQLGIPFFAIKHDLIIHDDGEAKHEEHKGCLDRGELRALQRKMLEHLEALFGDDA